MKESLGQAYREDDKLRGGPGGWGCPCCNPFYCHPRNMKHLARRVVRRKRKIETTKELHRVED